MHRLAAAIAGTVVAVFYFNCIRWIGFLKTMVKELRACARSISNALETTRSTLGR